MRNVFIWLWHLVWKVTLNAFVSFGDDTWTDATCLFIVGWDFVGQVPCFKGMRVVVMRCVAMIGSTHFVNPGTCWFCINRSMGPLKSPLPFEHISLSIKDLARCCDICCSDFLISVVVHTRFHAFTWKHMRIRYSFAPLPPIDAFVERVSEYWEDGFGIPFSLSVG